MTRDSLSLGDTMYTARQILVPVDFSDVSRAAISAALQIAADHGGSVHLLFVEEGMNRDLKRRLDTAPQDSVIEDTIRLNEQSLLDAAELEFQRCIDAGAPLPPVPLKVHVMGGDWLEQILELARSLELDLVVTGTHGRKGVKGILTGSISEKLVARSPCSVLVVKPHGFPYLRD
ncbi:MAG: universal stress protein [Myxococcota bacterium]|nr:universal stress protein [Myxococcota bacterium]